MTAPKRKAATTRKRSAAKPKRPEPAAPPAPTEPTPLPDPGHYRVEAIDDNTGEPHSVAIALTDSAGARVSMTLADPASDTQAAIAKLVRFARGDLDTAPGNALPTEMALAEHIHVSRLGRETALTIDGHKLPWYISEDGVTAHVGSGTDAPSVTIRILAAAVTVTDALSASDLPEGTP